MNSDSTAPAPTEQNPYEEHQIVIFGPDGLPYRQDGTLRWWIMFPGPSAGVSSSPAEPNTQEERTR